MTNKINHNRIGVVTTSRSAVVCVVLILIVMMVSEAFGILCYRKGCVKFYGSNTHLNQEKYFRHVYTMVSSHDLYISPS